jgi:chlorobactene glucosyltransferase
MRRTGSYSYFASLLVGPTATLSRSPIHASMTPLLYALPWLGILLFVELVTRIPSELPESDEVDARLPSVSVIVPARNEALNIVACLESVVASEYPDFEVIVVDDRSDDGTGELARSVPAGRAERLVVIDGTPLPDGWLGKPWACQQGVEAARGDLLLFTDADTVHGSALLRRAVAGQEQEQADLLTIVGRQLMETFWERLVQPQIFLAMLLRFPDFERIAKNARWRDAIANGQYLLFRRSAYEAIDGHEAVRDEVVEDLALAQHVKRAGLRLRIRGAETDLATRMYRSLPHLIEGWSKNIVMGGLQSFPGWMRPLVAPVSVVGGVLLWLVAPVVLVADLLGGPFGWVSGDVTAWAATVYGLSVVLWARFSRRMGAPGRYGLIYPLGAAVGSFIFLRSWVRGRNVTWKGRNYRLRPASERP